MANVAKVQVTSGTYNIEDSTARQGVAQNAADILNLKRNGAGMTADVKQALLACFQNVAWIDDDGQTYYDALEAALYPPANLVSISAVYTQSGTVYDTDSLNDLKSDLVVTAHYEDSSTATVTTYALSGTLTEGTSTITVTYSGKTTTFNVTVTEDDRKSDMTKWTDGIAYTNLEIVENSYYKAANGVIASYNGWDRTGYVPCEGAATIVFPPCPQEEDGSQVDSNRFFDANYLATGNRIQLSRTQSTTVTVPSTAAYFGLSSNASALASCINAGIVPHAPAHSDMDGWIDGASYANLDIVQNEYVATATGNISSYNGWDRTGYVPCEGASTITFPAMPQEGSSAVRSNFFYNSSKNPIQPSFTLSRTESTTVTVPSGGAYFIISSDSSALAACISGGIVPNA